MLAGRAPEAVGDPVAGLSAFRECGDRFGRAATRLWLALAHQDLQQPALFAANAEDGLALCEAHGYEFLFTAPSLSSPPDPRRLVPAS